MGFTCCQIFLESKTSFEDHQRRFHFPTSKFKNDNFECPLCRSSATMLHNYRRHLIKEHSSAVYDIFGQQQTDTEQQPIRSQTFSNPFEVRVNSNPIEVVHENVADLDDTQDEEDVEMHESSDSTCDEQQEYSSDDVPYFEKANEPDLSNVSSRRQIVMMFAKMLISLKFGLNMAHKHLNTIVITVLSFVYILMSNNVLDGALLTELMDIAKSKHYQDKYSRSLKLTKHPNNNFYYTDLNEIIQRYLSQPVICQQLFHEKKSTYMNSY